MQALSMASGLRKVIVTSTAATQGPQGAACVTLGSGGILETSARSRAHLGRTEAPFGSPAACCAPRR